MSNREKHRLNVLERRLVLRKCALLFGNTTAKIRRNTVNSTVLSKRKSVICHTMCQNKIHSIQLTKTIALQTSAHRQSTVRTRVKTSSGKMDHTDLILASNVMNAILDQCSKSSQEEQEETPALPVQLRDHKSRNLLLVIITEFEMIHIDTQTLLLEGIIFENII